MKTGFRKILPLALVLIAGAAGGFMRGRELVTCYDDVSGLYAPSSLTYLLIALSVVVSAVCLITAMAKPRDDRDFTPLYHCGPVGAVLGMAAGAFTALAGCIRLISFFESMQYSALPIGLLTVLAGISLIALTVARYRDNLSYMTGFGAVLTVFWGCLILVLVFLEHPVEPIILLFAYDLLAMCLVLLVLYGSTGRIFGKNHTRMTLAASLTAIYFLLVSGLGRFATFFDTGSFYYVRQVGFRLMIYAAMLPYCMSVALSLLLRIGTGTETAPAETESTEDDHEV